MKKKNGFIAISLIYSFFLVFLMTLMAILLNYAQNRILVNRIVNDTKTYLNGLVENDPTRLERKTYAVNSTVNYLNMTWQVLKDNDAEKTVTLVLRNALSATDINNILNRLNFTIPHTGQTIRMCLNTLNDYYCYYRDSANYQTYNYQNSVVKSLVEEWQNGVPDILKAITNNSLESMSFNVNGSTINTYVRIMSKDEASIVNDNNTWTYTYFSVENGISYLQRANGTKVSSQDALTIRPVITVKKN